VNRLRPHLLFAPLLLLLLPVSGCKRFEVVPHGDYVYVVAKQTFLRDRVAAVSNKVAVVNNGERLEVVDHGRRFLKVKTAAGATGWLEEHAVIDQADYDKFKALHDAELKAVAVSTAVLRDDLYAHLLPGRDTPHFLLLPENDRLELLQRASIPKPDAQAAWLKPANKTVAAPGKAPVETPVKPMPHGKHGKVRKETEAARFVDPNAPPMEDWWLVRDSGGRIGWVLARRLDVDVPDEVVQYTEGQRIVGAYLLNKVSDPDSKFPNGLAPNYVAVLSPYKDGLPYDYDQIRVFAWNVKKHRYEGAYRKRDIAGYLPVVVTQQVVEASGPLAATPVPVFTVKIATDSAVPSLDPDTGLVRKVDTEEQSFSLEGETVKRLLPAGQPAAPKAAAAPRTAAPPTHIRHRSRAAAPKRHRHR
jgi:SH3-like domain-containing protein